MIEPQLRVFQGDTPQAEEIMEIANLWRAVFAQAEALAGRGTPETIDVDRMSIAMTAAAIMSGTFFGNLLAGGLANEQDKRRVTESFTRNFRSGIDIGRRQGERVIGQMPVGGHA